jgi:predicted AAA+ superfamily ATPase
MPHLRNRRVAQHLKKMAKLWPVVGVLGPRQSGKTTLLERILALKNTVFLDDFRVRSEARQSPQTFVDRLELPVLIDEVQKAPELFDALKHRIDRKRRPGAYYLTGSASFSSRLGIRESLTGRIGLVELSPLSLSELQELPPLRVPPLPLGETRFDSGTIAKSFAAGGMPIPAFLRDSEQRRLYWDTWLDTTLHRDLALVLRKSYDPDFFFKNYR